MPTSNLAALESRCQELDGEFLRLAGRFADAANSLRQGCLPDDKITTELESLRERFAAVAEFVRGSAGEDLPAGLADLRDALTRLRAQDEQRQGHLRLCCDRLAKVLALRRQDGETFPALQSCQSIARGLLARTSEPRTTEPDPELARLAEGGTGSRGCSYWWKRATF